MKIRYLAFLFLITNLMYSQLDDALIVIDKETDISKKIHLIEDALSSGQSSLQHLALANKAFSLSKFSNQENLIAKSAIILGKQFYLSNAWDSAFHYLNVSENIYVKLNDQEGLFNSYLTKAECLKRQNKLEASLDITNKLIDIAEHLDNPDKKGYAYYKMGQFFFAINDIEKQIIYFNKALKTFILINDLKEIEKCYYKLGNCYIEKSYNDYAIEYFNRGLKINENTNNCEFKVNFLTGIGHVYFNLLNNEKALFYFKEALAVQEKCDPEFTGSAKNNIAVVLMDLERYKEAKSYLIEAYFASQSARSKADGAYNLAQTYEQLGDYNSAMDYMDIYIRMNDSINNAINTKNLSEIEAKYRNEKQEEQNVLLKERIKYKSTQIYFALAGIVLLAGMLFFIFRGLKQKQKTNLALEEKNKIIEEKNIIVVEQHKDITDSIKYAQRIQQAILPPDKLWSDILPDSFVFYQPKDILSGDFYWIEETAEHIFIAAADCTGHGVPGALMSIVNYNLLNKAVLEQELSDAGKILDSVNKLLTQSLHQTFQESAVRDGMDISLCVINKETKRLNFAGAFNSIYIIRSNEIKELTPDKQPVGAFIEDNIKPFTNKYLQLMENDIVYMFTDGYADQFGGEKGKKFKYKNLQHLLLEIHHKPFPEQKKITKNWINDWKGNLEQIDDILLLGYKIS